MKKRRLATLLICTMMCLSFLLPNFRVKAAGLAGSGLQNDPYIISDVSELKQLSSMDTVDKYYEITSDLDLSGENWQSLGTFSGYLNGKHQRIIGLNAPLFSALDEAKISNMNFEQNSGTALAQMAKDSSITGCLSEHALVGSLLGGEIKSSLAAGESNGGLLAKNGDGDIENCVFVGNIAGETTFEGSISSSYYDKSVAGGNAEGFTGLSTTELMTQSIPGMCNVAEAYPYPGLVSAPPMIAMPLSVTSGDSFGKITENISLPGTWQGKTISWTVDHEVVSGTTDFEFPCDQKKTVTLLANSALGRKSYRLTLDRMILIEGKLENGNVITSGTKTNKKAMISLSGYQAMEYKLDDSAYQSYGNPFPLEKAADLRVRYVGDTQDVFFQFDYYSANLQINDFGLMGAGYLGFRFSHDGTYTKDGGSTTPITAGTLVKEPGVYSFRIEDEYGNYGEADYTIKPLPLGSTDFMEVQSARVQLLLELAAASSLPTDYLTQMQQAYLDLLSLEEELEVQQFDADVLTAVTDAEIEALYWTYQDFTEEQRALVQNGATYRALVNALRSKRLTNEQYHITVVPHGELPIDVYLQVEKTEKGYRISLLQNGQPYQTDMAFTVKMPYSGDQKIYFNGKEVEFTVENGMAIFTVDNLGAGGMEYWEPEPKETTDPQSMAAEQTIPAKDQSAVDEAGSIGGIGEIPAVYMGGLVVVIFAVGTILFKTKQVDID